MERLMSLPEGHWFDSGAGHAFAVRQALEMPEAKNLKATIVAFDTVATSKDHLKVISGRFLENIRDAEIPKSDLITDVVGPLAYSGAPHLVLQKYLNNLKPQGEIYIFLGSRHELYGASNKVLTARGELLNLGQWLEQLPGIKTDLVKTPINDDGHYFEMWTVRITKEKADVRIPEVEMIHFTEGAPPTMTFKEVSSHGIKNFESLQEQARDLFKHRAIAITASDFLDAFRGGELRHPLIASLKKLKNGDRWVNSSEVGEQVFAGMKKKDYGFEDVSVFLGLSQTFIRWRAQGINTDKMTYTALGNTVALRDVKDVKLITDYHGDFVSSFAPDIVLKRYLDSLSDKGEIYLYMGQEYGGYGTASKVLKKDGTKLTLRTWVREQAGLSVDLFRGGYPWATGEWAFLKIKIKDRQKIQIPKLRLGGTSLDKEGNVVAYFEEL